jgi:hypothetical protein
VKPNQLGALAGLTRHIREHGGSTDADSINQQHFEGTRHARAQGRSNELLNGLDIEHHVK